MQFSNGGNANELWSSESVACESRAETCDTRCGGSTVLCSLRTNHKLCVMNVESRFFVSDTSKSLRLPLFLVFAVVAMVTDTVKSPLDCKFRGTCLCAGPNLSWCPPFASLFGKMLAVPLLEVSIFKSGFKLVQRLL